MGIEFKINIEVNTEKVFNAITTAEGYRAWWAKVCSVDCNLNGISSIRFEMKNFTEEMVFRAKEVEKNKKLVSKIIFSFVN